MSIQRSKAFSSRARIGLPSLTPAVQRDQLEFLAVVALIDAGHQDGGGLLAEFAGDIADADFLVGLARGAVDGRGAPSSGYLSLAPDARTGSGSLRAFGDGLEDEGLHDRAARAARPLPRRASGRRNPASRRCTCAHAALRPGHRDNRGPARSARSTSAMPAVILLQRPFGVAAIDQRLGIIGPQRDGPAIAFDRLVIALQVAQHIAAAVQGRRCCCGSSRSTWSKLASASWWRARSRNARPRLPQASLKSRLQRQGPLRAVQRLGRAA